MFIEQGINKENKFWKYLVGSGIIIAASAIGNLPLGIGVVVKALADGREIPATSEAMMTILDSNLTLFLLMFSFVLALGAIFLVVKYFHKQTVLSVTTARGKMDWNRVFFSFSVWAVFTIVTTALMYFQNPQDFVINFKPLPFAILFVISLVMIPIQTSTEEYVFRGYLMQGFGNLAMNKWFPLLMTSLIFGTMHILNPEVEKLGYISLVYYIGTGLFLGIITLMDDGMELALGFHAANNLIGALLVTSDWTVFQTHSILKDISEPNAGIDILFPVLVIFPILLFIFSKKYGWTHWKSKLFGQIQPSLTEDRLINDTQKDDNNTY